MSDVEQVIAEALAATPGDEPSRECESELRGDWCDYMAKKLVKFLRSAGYEVTKTEWEYGDDVETH